MLLAHMLTDFILQPKSWTAERAEKHFRSPRLYLHTLITAFIAWVLTGFTYWQAAVVILVTHILFDGWKLYRKSTVFYFVADQLLHLLVILACWFFIFLQWQQVKTSWHQITADIVFWKMLAGFVFVTSPASALIDQLTKLWRDKIPEAANLANAGKWIGIIERIIILVFVINGQYSAIGLLVAAKSIIRFNEKDKETDKQEIKTEYLVIGTLMSICLALLTGLAVKY